ncbi:MAG: LCP family protein [bacterium]|nr:LCP family protein [bacterium]
MIDFKQKLEENEPEILDGELSSEDKRLIAAIRKRRRAKNYFVALIVLAIVFSGKVIMSGPAANQWLSNSFLGRISHLTESDDNRLEGEANDRINILLLGMGGANHDGGYLADTIMLVSLKPSTKQAALISIPRDLTVPTEGGAWRKVNSIHATAEARESGTGGEAMMTSLSSILAVDISYFVRVDFEGFVKIIDELGGVTVNVENTIDDYTYPIKGREEHPDYYSRFEHLHIDAGEQHMDGSLALKYARSRHAAGISGSDFDRARRQQIIIEAVKDKLLSRNTLLKPGMLTRIISELNKNIKTNLDIWELIKLWNDYKSIDRSMITNQVLSDGPDNYLMASRGESGAYILIPKTGNFNDIQTLVRDIFGEVAEVEQKNDSNKIEEVEEITKIEKIESKAKVAVLNGTWVSGLAAKTALELQNYGFEITETANAPTREYDNSVIYDLSFGKDIKALETLKAAGAASLAYDAPSWLETYKNSADHPDFILIIGSDQS